MKKTTIMRIPWHKIHFTGCGGVGMAGLAHIVLDLGARVTGSDAVDSYMLQSLRKRGCDVRIGHAPVPADSDLLVYSSAVPENDPERTAAAQAGIPQLQRGRFLAELARHFKQVIAVSGSHGKTTTTAMLAHIAREAGLQPGYMVGGHVNTWNTYATAGKGELLITEVDESDGTQACMHASAAVILNIEDDHCWSHGGVEALEKCFRTFAEKADETITWNSGNAPRVLNGLPHLTLLPPVIPTREELPLPVPGAHNRSNAAMAVSAARRFLNIPPEKACGYLASFPGVDRRLSCRFRSPDSRILLYEDYAHHPTEVRATVRTLREEFPGHRLHIIFQPHRFERVLRYADDFAEILSGCDAVELIAPFAAWVADKDKADPRDILAKMRKIRSVPARYWDEDKNGLPAILTEELSRLQESVVLAVVGAGDIGRLVPEIRRRLLRPEQPQNQQ